MINSYNIPNNDPRSIYDFVKNSINNISSIVLDIENKNIDIDKKVDNSQIKSIINNLQEKVSTNIHQLETNSECKVFHIAFFGETNAGKSTIIETLRILLREKTKIDQQQNFNEILSKMDISHEKFNQAKDELEKIEFSISSLNDDIENLSFEKNKCLNDLENKYNRLEEKLEQSYEEKIKYNKDKISSLEKDIKILPVKIEEIKSSMPWWMKIIYIFIKLDEEKELYQINLEYSDIVSKNESLIGIIKTEKESLKNQLENEKSIIEDSFYMRHINLSKSKESLDSDKQDLQDYINSFDAKKQKLLPFLDGKIMGDGRSDFTRESTAYSFTVNHYDVSMIDVPGIEGDEKIVHDEITKAVQKTHAVFYVTSKDAPPNEGTLSRIQQYLNDQTEVWAIYNKQVTNPRQLNRSLINSDDEKKSLNDLEEKLKSVLGKNYCGLFVLAGLPAFLSQATCLEPLSMMQDTQNKFLAKIDRNGLYEFSQLGALDDKLKSSIIGDLKAKIKKNNYNKVKVLLDDSCLSLEEIHNTYEHYQKDLKREIEISQQSIFGHFDDFNMQVRGNIHGLIDNFQQECRAQIYHEIDSDIENDEFKNRLKSIIKEKMGIFEESSVNSIKNLVEDLEEKIVISQKRLSGRINNLGKEYHEYSTMNSKEFSLDFKLDNGVNKLALLGTVVGILLSLGTGGWAAVVGAIGLVVSLVKSVYGFFDSDYKKEQQKKNADTNLSTVAKKLRDELSKSLSVLNDNLDESKKETIKYLNDISRPIEHLNENISTSIDCLKRISNQINTDH